MRIEGLWAVCDDGIVRPVIRGRLQAQDGSWVIADFLVDSGADRTVICADVLGTLGVTTVAGAALGGVGGTTATVLVTVPLRMREAGGVDVNFHGRFAAFTDPAALDTCVLGRDILDLFTVIIDRRRDTVCLLNAPHSYTIHSP